MLAHAPAGMQPRAFGFNWSPVAAVLCDSGLAGCKRPLLSDPGLAAKRCSATPAGATPAGFGGVVLPLRRLPPEATPAMGQHAHCAQRGAAGPTGEKPPRPDHLGAEHAPPVGLAVAQRVQRGTGRTAARRGVHPRPTKGARKRLRRAISRGGAPRIARAGASADGRAAGASPAGGACAERWPKRPRAQPTLGMAQPRCSAAAWRPAA